MLSFWKARLLNSKTITPLDSWRRRRKYEKNQNKTKALTKIPLHSYANNLKTTNSTNGTCKLFNLPTVQLCPNILMCFCVFFLTNVCWLLKSNNSYCWALKWWLVLFFSLMVIKNHCQYRCYLRRALGLQIIYNYSRWGEDAWAQFFLWQSILWQVIDPSSVTSGKCNNSLTANLPISKSLLTKIFLSQTAILVTLSKTQHHHS